MLKSAASESCVVLQSITGCTVDETFARLKHMGWRLAEPVQLSKGISLITAVSKKRHMVLYTKHGRVWTANFGRPNDGTIKFMQVSAKSKEPQPPALVRKSKKSE
jgi:hypothetical protein